MNGLAEPQQQLFLVTVALVAKGAGDPMALDAASDADVAAAAAALAGTYETAAKGLIYEQSAGSAPAQRIAAEIRQAYDEFGRTNPRSFAVRPPGSCAASRPAWTRRIGRDSIPVGDSWTWRSAWP